MKRPEKEAVVAQLTDEFRSADAVYLTEYRGLTVPQISDLREKLGRDTSYTVAKNTLARIAAKEAGIEGLDEILSGPTAITFVHGDFIAAAKVMTHVVETLEIDGLLVDTFLQESEPEVAGVVADDGIDLALCQIHLAAEEGFRLLSSQRDVSLSPERSVR